MDSNLPAPLPADEAARYARQSLSPATLEAYRADWQDFTTWCSIQKLLALPAADTTVAAYLSSLARTHGRSALRRRLSAISQAHKLKRIDWTIPPLVRRTLRGILREHGIPARQAAALTTPEIKKLVATCDTGLTGKRDRAIILIGYAGALRRSEIVAIERQHVSFTVEGLRLHIPRSKGDQAGQGAEIGLAKGDRRETCPIRALQDWLEVSKCKFGPVFRKVDLWGGIDDRALQPNAVRLILKRRAAMAGITVGAMEALTSHGLRSGFVTQAFISGVSDEVIMNHTRHRDHKTMRGYVRRAKLVSESPAKKLGL